jgi:hypothetical protein
LMKRVGGENYARGRISDYMKRMHGETSGPWVIPDRAGPDTGPRQSIARSSSLANRPSSLANRPSSLANRKEKQLPLRDASSNPAMSDAGQSEQPGGVTSARAGNRASTDDVGPSQSQPAPSQLDGDGNRNEAER